MGMLVTAAEVQAGQKLLVGLNTARSKVADIAGQTIALAAEYNGIIAALDDGDDQALAAERFSQSVAAVKEMFAAEDAATQATIAAFFDGMGFVPKV